jgi:hypothetical protein
MIADPHELYKFVATPGDEVTHLLFANDDVVWVTWRVSEEEKIPSLRHTNEVIGAYVTTGAQLKLYSYLDTLGVRALYCDIDSVIYVEKETQARLVKCGEKLGDMTNELPPGEYIEEFVSGGPKNYAYRLAGGKTVCKVLGINLNYSAFHLVNFDIIRDIILKGKEGEKREIVVCTEEKIKRKKGQGGVAIVTEPEDKIYRLSFHKRRCLNNSSASFGYKTGLSRYEGD